MLISSYCSFLFVFVLVVVVVVFAEDCTEMF